MSENNDITNFVTENFQITISFQKVSNRRNEECNDKYENVPSKMIIETKGENLQSITKDDDVRIYFFVKLNDDESNCFEFAIFDPKVSFNRQGHISKTIPFKNILASENNTSLIQVITFDPKELTHEIKNIFDKIWKVLGQYQ